MKNFDIARDVRRRDLHGETAFAGDSDAQFTPADFLKDAGILIAVCLGLGLLMRVLVG